MEKTYVVGIDVGGQSVKLGVIDHDANIVARSKFDMSVYGYDDTERFLEDLCSNVRELVSSSVGIENVHGIGIGAPNGNYYDGTVVNAANLPWAKGKVVQVRAYLSEKLGLDVTMTNDANAAAIGEMIYGNAKGMKNFIEITLGTGVGSGIVTDGRVLYGHDGFAGELGHTIAVRGGRKCGCGRNGCLETYASSRGVVMTAKEMLEASSEPSLLRNIENISSKDVYDAAVQGDKIAIEVFAFTGKILGRQFADFVTFSAPEAIILFGGVANAGDLLLEPVKASMEEEIISLWRGKVKVLRSGLPESDAAILGAGALAW